MMNEGTSRPSLKIYQILVAVLLTISPLAIIEIPSSSDHNLVSDSLNEPISPGVGEEAFIDYSFNLDGVFHKNIGQMNNPRILFYAKGDPLTVGLMKDGVLFRLHDEADSFNGPMNEYQVPSRASWTFTMRFLGSSPGDPYGSQPDNQTCHYYIGKDPDQWFSDVPVFREVRYPSLYDGIDLRFYFKDGMFKYDLEVAPGSDPSQILIKYDGVDNLEIDEMTKDLFIHTPVGSVRDVAPLLFPNSEISEGIHGEFILLDQDIITFMIPDCINSQDGFVIDPGLQYSTHFGGTSHDRGRDVDIDSDGNVYIVGYTLSDDLPNTTGQGALYDWYDMFVAKFDPTLSKLLFATYIGGHEGTYGTEDSRNIAVLDDSGVYIMGFTVADDFPTTPGVISRNNAGLLDCVVAKLAMNGSLIASTYIGGAGTERCRGLILDDSGDLLIAGGTESNDFPTTSGAHCHTRDSSRRDTDLFIMRVSGDLDRIIHSTYIGGTDSEETETVDLAIGPEGHIYACGCTKSKDFPYSNGAFCTTFNGANWDGVVFKLDMNLSTMLDSTYLGSQGEDWMFSIEVGSDSTVYVGGEIYNGDWPLTTNAFDNETMSYEGVVAFLDENLTEVKFCSYLGGFHYDGVSDLLLNEKETTLYLNGYSRSSDLNASNGSYDYWINGFYDVYLASINLSTFEREYLTYIGGAAYEVPYLAQTVMTSAGHVVMTGYTASIDFPTTSGSYQPEKNNVRGYLDAYVLIMDPEPCPPPPGPVLNATPGNGFVDLTWVLEVEWSVVTWYKLLRGTTEGNITEIINLTRGFGYNDTDVINGWTYYYQVTAYNSAGWGDRSEVVSALPLGSPSVPRNLTCHSGDGKVHLSWDPPYTTGGGELSGYRIYRNGTSSVEDFHHYANVDNRTSWSDDDVVLGEIYYYKILALNLRFISELSGEAYTKATGPPSPPRNLIVNPGDGLVDLVWDPPESNGGSTLLGYRVYRGKQSDTPRLLEILLPNAMNFTDTTVVNGIKYTYMITSFSPINESEPAGPLPAIPYGPPESPFDLVATGGDGQIELTWRYPEIEVFEGELRFNIHAGPLGSDLELIMTIIEDTSFLHTGLTNGDTWSYQVTAITDYGFGPPSQLISGTPIGPTGSPIDLITMAGDGSVELTWNLPSDTGGTNVITYVVYRGTEPTNLIRYATVSGDATNFTDTEVMNGIKYHYAVSAVTIVGEGPTSATKEATPAGPPSDPQGFDAVLGDERVVLTWSPPASDGGSEVIKYHILRGMSIGSLAILSEVTDGMLYIDSDVEAGTTYYYSVTAVNERGEGVHADIKEVHVLMRPGIIQDVSFKSKEDTVRISWSPPESNGGTPITGYRLLRGSKADSLFIIQELGLVNSATDENVTEGTTYWYSIFAVNAVGEGDYSPVQKVSVQEKDKLIGNAPIWLLALIVILVLLAALILIMLMRKPIESSPAKEPEGPITEKVPEDMEDNRGDRRDSKSNSNEED